MRKTLTPFPEPKALAQVPTTSQVDPEKIWWEKLAQLGEWPYLQNKRGPAGWVTLLAEPTFCFPCKQLAKFCKEIYEVCLSRVARLGGWSLYQWQRVSIERGSKAVWNCNLSVLWYLRKRLSLTVAYTTPIHLQTHWPKNRIYLRQNSFLSQVKLMLRSIKGTSNLSISCLFDQSNYE